MNLLMLDLEGTIISVKRNNNGDYYKRPSADKFLSECQKLFDKIYLNTSVPEKFAREIMEEKFNFTKFDYWNWRIYHTNKDKKTQGYEIFKQDRIIQVDDFLGEAEKEDFVRYGVIYLPIACFNPKDESHLGDSELLRVLGEINKNLGRN